MGGVDIVGSDRRKGKDVVTDVTPRRSSPLFRPVVAEAAWFVRWLLMEVSSGW